MNIIQKLVFLLPILLFLSPNIFSQTNNATLSVYLDCRSCNETFIRSEIDFVNFVRDQSVAEVQLLITSQGTGGGRQYTLEFFGLAQYGEVDNKLIFISPQADTDELRRNRLVKYVKLGLINYLSEKDVIDQLEVSFVGSNDPKEDLGPINDPWNGWNFELGASTNFSGEESRKNYRLDGEFEAQRTTENWKVRLDFRQNYNKRIFISKDSLGNEERDEFIVESQNVFGLVAKTISNHWTVGSYGRARSSTQDNLDFRVGLTPTIEYSLFPYSEFARREVTFRYGMLAEQNFYSDTTIFNKTEEFLLRQELSINTRFTQPWGGIDGRINAGNYMHDFSKNRLDFNLYINMRISRLLSFQMSARYSIINDQLSIPAGDASDAEVLLNLRNQATSYNFGGSFGIELNFGSLYNNVVNSRF
jgi:hypothetical protein